MIPLAEAAPGGGGAATVTLVTGVLLALSAVVSSVVTPVILARRRSRNEAAAAAAAAAAKSGDLTLAGWTALNAALQAEIGRLQGVQERMQARIDALEAEIAELQKLALPLLRGTAGA